MAKEKKKEEKSKGIIIPKDTKIIPIINTTEMNMKLWNQVCITDPKITKDVKYGSYNFTAIDAQAQIRRATELWGRYGDKWGVKDCNTRIISDAKEEPIGISLEATFYYPDGEFEIASDMKYSPSGDCMKKLLTDLTTKALSKLGFNSDVFEGKFEDNKYVEGLNKEFGNETKIKKYKPEIPDPKSQESQTNKSGKMTIPQRDHLNKIMKSHLLNDKEKKQLADMTTFQDASDFLGNWWDGKDGKAGERTKREYIEAYLKVYMKQEGKTSLSDDFKKVKYQEARAKMEGLSASQVKALTKELKE